MRISFQHRRFRSSTGRRSVCSSAASFASVALIAAVGALASLSAACGGGDGPGDGVDCGFPEGTADSYLPFEPAFRWTYRVTDLGSGVQSEKTQTVNPSEVTDEDFPGLSFLEQTTVKFGGRTVSLLAREGDALVRYKQEDFDELDAFERVTLYDPPKLRIDEGRASAGTTYDESYTKTITDALDVTVVENITDSWEVIGVDVPCSSPFGELECIQLRRIRTVGGTANKDFFFAFGVGKVREEGTEQIEELIDCAPQ